MSIATEIQRLQTAKADIKTAIENKGVEVGDGLIDTYAEKIGEISSGGGDYEQGYEDGFNSAPQNYLPYLASWSFNRAVFPEDKRDVKLYFSPKTTVGTANNWFGYTNATSLTVIGDTITTFYSRYGFSNNSELKTIDLSQCGNGVIKLSESAEYTFQNCTSLEEIIGELDCSDVINFYRFVHGCVKLREIRITPLTVKYDFSLNVSPNLSNESIQSIIDGLADLAGQTTQTLTFHSTVGAKLTDTQKATITAKNWTLAY